MGKALRLEGKRFGKLLVESRVYAGVDAALPYQSAVGHVLWRCRCDCGNTKVVLGGYLKHPRPKIKSCGCVRTAMRASSLRWKGFGEISGEYWSRVSRSAVKRGLSVTITIEEAWQIFLSQGRRCALSGLPLAFATEGRKVCDGTASIDRIDSRLGYVPGNVQWLHKDINRLKDHFSDARVIELCGLVTRHQQKKRRQTKQ